MKISTISSEVLNKLFVFLIYKNRADLFSKRYVSPNKSYNTTWAEIFLNEV